MRKATACSTSRPACCAAPGISGAIRRRFPVAPSIAAAVALVAWPRSNGTAASIRLPRAGMEIDFGGIGKEYAADRVATICLEHGLRHGLVNLGGDVRAIGPQADGTPWRVGIRHPARRGRRDRGLRPCRPARWPPAATTSATSKSAASATATSSTRDGHAGGALAIDQRRVAVVRGRRQLRDDCDAARSRRRRHSSMRRACSGSAWPPTARCIA